jgi:hypothetical protein
VVGAIDFLSDKQQRPSPIAPANRFDGRRTRQATTDDYIFDVL